MMNHKGATTGCCDGRDARPVARRTAGAHWHARKVCDLCGASVARARPNWDRVLPLQPRLMRIDPSRT